MTAKRTTDNSPKAKAARCRDLALKAKEPADRERWFAMERYWLQRVPDGAGTPNVVKV